MNQLFDDTDFDYGEIFDIGILGKRYSDQLQRFRLLDIALSVLELFPNAIMSLNADSHACQDIINRLYVENTTIRARLYIDKANVYSEGLEDTGVLRYGNLTISFRDEDSICHLLSTCYIIICPWPNIDSYDMAILKTVCEDSAKIMHRVIFVANNSALVFNIDGYTRHCKEPLDLNELLLYVSVKFLDDMLNE